MPSSLCGRCSTAYIVSHATTGLLLLSGHDSRAQKQGRKKKKLLRTSELSRDIFNRSVMIDSTFEESLAKYLMIDS